MRLIVSLMFAAAIAAPAIAQPPAAPPAASAGPLVRAGATEKLTEHVWDIPDFSTPGVPNVGIIMGSRAVLVVDTGMGARNGQTILAEVAKIAPNKPLYLVTTHIHPEHDLGAGAFPASTQLIRSQTQVAEIAETGMTTANAFSARSAINAELLKDAQFRTANITYEREYSLDLGGVRVRILAIGPNHTRGDTAIFVEGDRVLFSGDVAMRAQPAFASPQSSVAHWLTALDQLAALNPLHVVPSHGPRGDGAYISGYRTYLTRIRDRAQALKTAGKTQDEAVATITEEMAAQYTDRGRLGGAIRNAYAEAR